MHFVRSVLKYTSGPLLFLSWKPTIAAVIHSQVNSTLGNRRGKCTASSDWIGRGYNQLDCIRAVDYMYTQDVIPRDSQVYEFLAPGSTPISRSPEMATPIVYKSGRASSSS